MKKVLFLNHSQTHCGVYQFGKRVYTLASKSRVVEYIYKELETKGEYLQFLSEIQPDYIIYNWYPITMHWLTEDIIVNNKNTKHYFIFHDGNVRRNYDKYLFFGAEGKDLNFPKEKTVILPRPLFTYDGEYPKNEVITIGSFGFGGWQKGFPNLVSRVNEEFEKAVINIQMPFAYFGDRSGAEAVKIAEACYNKNTNPNIQLNIDHTFLEDDAVLSFLAGNDINVFLYAAQNQGLSSVIDYALSVKRPIAITNDMMFKHIYKPEIDIDNFGLQEIIDMKTTYLKEYYKIWNPDKFHLEMDKLFDE